MLTSAARCRCLPHVPIREPTCNLPPGLAWRHPRSKKLRKYLLPIANVGKLLNGIIRGQCRRGLSMARGSTTEHRELFLSLRDLSDKRWCVRNRHGARFIEEPTLMIANKVSPMSMQSNTFYQTDLEIRFDCRDK